MPSAFVFCLQAVDADEMLDAEALQQLLGGSGFDPKALSLTLHAFCLCVVLAGCRRR
jgi:hypothetical protein